MSRISLPTLALLALPACASQGAATASPSQPPTAGADATPPDAEAPPAAAQLDDSPPMSLDAWRTIRDEGEAAARVADVGQRIEQCKSFVAKHGAHQETSKVLESLADAMVETGSYDAAELAEFVEQRCASDEDAGQLPVELVREYHVKHKLPLDSALRLLAEARSRIDDEWQEDVEREKDDKARERAEAWLSYRRIQTYMLEGRVNLQHGKPEAALKALDKARAQSKTFPSDIEMVGTGGNKLGTVSSGLLDELHVLTAAALTELGRTEEAKAAFGRAVGFVSDVEMRQIYADTRTALGFSTKDDRTITAEALPAFDFTLEDLDGKKVKLSDYRGKVVLVTFWATWCGPCKKEMPELQKFLDANEGKGVEVIAINTDSFNDRSKVAPFLKKNDIGLKVLFEDEQQLSSYNYAGIPALYVIDRKGRIAHARTGYDPDLKTKLENEVAALVDGTKDPSRELFAVEVAPAGFDVVWKQSVTGDVNALAVAEPIGKAPGQIGAVGRKGLMRWSATGEEQKAEGLAGWTMSLSAADLDGDGKREWVAGGWQSLKVLDSQGESYWDYKTERMAEVEKIVDLDGDGFKEIVLKDEDRIVAMKAVPKPQWKTEAIDGLESLVVAPGGEVVAQAEGVLTTYGADGRVLHHGRAAPEGRMHRATLQTKDGEVELFGGRWDSQPVTDFDIDGDGENDIVVTGHSGVVAYDARGNTILRIRGKDTGLTTALGDLDGKPGDELAIFVDHYGLVVLGVSR
mgnify:CR=1 FL=1